MAKRVAWDCGCVEVDADLAVVVVVGKEARESTGLYMYTFVRTGH